MNSTNQPLLSIEDQISHLMSKGVTFDNMSQEDAVSYLRDNNNYFKLRAFRKNYDKYQSGKNEGKYIKLDFFALCDLATIDMHLRYVLLQVALNTEHFLKVKLLRKMEENHEDGYTIVTDFRDYLKSEDAKNQTRDDDRVESELSRNKDNPYCGGIIAACSDGYSIWAFIEVISLGSLLRLYFFCAKRFSDKDMVNDFYLMHYVRNIRNAAAHNNCIINDLRPTDYIGKPDKQMCSLLTGRDLIPKKTFQKRISNIRILQICTLLYTHKKLCSDKANAAVKKILYDLIARMKRHSELYKSNTLLVGCFHFFNNVVDILFKDN